MPTENQTAEQLPSLATGDALDASTWTDFDITAKAPALNGTTLPQRFLAVHDDVSVPMSPLPTNPNAACAALASTPGATAVPFPSK